MDTQKKPAGLRKEGAALLLIAALLFGFGLAGCGEDPATADEIAAAVVAKVQPGEKEDDTLVSNYPTTLQGAFEAMLKKDADSFTTVTVGKAISGSWTQTDAAYTVTGTGTEVEFSPDSTLMVYPSTGDSIRYTVLFKQKTAASPAGTSLSIGSSRISLAGSVAIGATATAEVVFQIINPAKRGEVMSGTITLKLTPSEAYALENLVDSFESALMRFNSVSDQWIEKPLDGTWAQTDAKYSAIVSGSALDSGVSLPSLSGTRSVTWTKTSAPTEVELSGSTLSASSTVSTGTITLGFELKDSQVATKSIKGSVVLTIK